MLHVTTRSAIQWMDLYRNLWAEMQRDNIAMDDEWLRIRNYRLKEATKRIRGVI